MQIDRVSRLNYVVLKNNKPDLKKNKEQNIVNNCRKYSNNYVKTPIDFHYNVNINFTGDNNRHIVKIPLIEFENYKTMSNAGKERLRRLYKNFENIIDETQKQTLLSIDPHPEYMKIPLQSEKDMDKFIEVAQMYSKYKDHPIICLGRSPKWFLNASLWMKNGIEDYKFVAFSGRWYLVYDGDFHDNRGLVRMDNWAPNKTEEKAYRKYLKNIQADPISIIKRTQQAGHKTIITDYVDTGKGFTSFLELMSNYAKDLGVLDEFGHSIEILSIGNTEYRRNRKQVKYISEPHVHMPPLLEPYDIQTTAWGTGQIMEQKYYDVDYNVFKELLINQNPNECRSTYYPCCTWTIYKPDKFKMGIIKDMKKIKDFINKFIATAQTEKPVFIFDPVMSAYRNLLNFRILDGLNARGLLKSVHVSKI